MRSIKFKKRLSKAIKTQWKDVIRRLRLHECNGVHSVWVKNTKETQP